ncbi:MAG: hypothetical protein U0992_15630 [Planctomycetaceae bacterium]
MDNLRGARRIRSDESQVLHEDRIDAGRSHLSDELFQFVEFVGKRQRIECHVPARLMPPQECHDIRQLVDVEIRRPGPAH